MDIRKLSPIQVQLPTTGPVRAPLPAWPVGAIIDALVISDLQAGTVNLRINELVLQAQTNLPLRAGQAMKLEVASQGLQPVLRLVSDFPIAEMITGQALRSALPRHSGLAPLFANLAAITQSSAAALPPLPEPVARLARQLFAALPDAKQVATPQGLKQAIRDSGLFLENKVQHVAAGDSGAALETDLKAGLLRLYQALQTAVAGKPAATDALHPEGPEGNIPRAPAPTAGMAPATDAPPPLRGTPVAAQARLAASLSAAMGLEGGLQELLHQVDGALARTQLHQLATLADPAQPLWSLDLPVRHQERVDVFQLRLFEEPAASVAPGQQIWRVTLGFHLERLGPVRVEISLANGAISTLFWAENPATQKLFQEHLALLRDRMAGAGLRVGQLGCRHGAPPRPDSGTPPSAVLDVQA